MRSCQIKHWILICLHTFPVCNKNEIFSSSDLPKCVTCNSSRLLFQGGSCRLFIEHEGVTPRLRKALIPSDVKTSSPDRNLYIAEEDYLPVVFLFPVAFPLWLFSFSHSLGGSGGAVNQIGKCPNRHQGGRHGIQLGALNRHPKVTGASLDICFLKAKFHTLKRGNTPFIRQLPRYAHGTGPVKMIHNWTGSIFASSCSMLTKLLHSVNTISYAAWFVIFVYPMKSGRGHQASTGSTSNFSRDLLLSKVRGQVQVLRLHLIPSKQVLAHTTIWSIWLKIWDKFTNSVLIWPSAAASIQSIPHATCKWYVSSCSAETELNCWSHSSLFWHIPLAHSIILVPQQCSQSGPKPNLPLCPCSSPETVNVQRSILQRASSRRGLNFQLISLPSSSTFLLLPTIIGQAISIKRMPILLRADE